MTCHVAMFTEAMPPVINGVSTAVQTLASSLADPFTVSVVAPQVAGYQDDQLNVVRIPSFETSFNRGYPFAKPWNGKYAVQSLRQGTVDLIHCHHPFGMGIVATYVARQLGVPFIAQHHTHYECYLHYLVRTKKLAGHLEQALWQWLRWFYNQLAKPEAIIVPSQYTERKLRAAGILPRLAVIPTGVPLPPAEWVSHEAQQRARAQLGIPPDAPFLLYVGRLAKEKNLELLFKTFELAGNKHSELYLVLVGDGPYRTNVQRMQGEHSRRNNIVLAGALPRAQLDPVYAAAHLLVHPSATETQGLVVAEARAAGCPALVIEDSGTSEFIWHYQTGFASRPSDGSLASFITLTFNRPVFYREIQIACLEHAKLHTPDIMVRKVAELYHTILSR